MKNQGKWDRAGAECWEGCNDPDCPYTHPVWVPLDSEDDRLQTREQMLRALDRDPKSNEVGE